MRRTRCRTAAPARGSGQSGCSAQDAASAQPGVLRMAHEWLLLPSRIRGSVQLYGCCGRRSAVGPRRPVPPARHACQTAASPHRRTMRAVFTRHEALTRPWAAFVAARDRTRVRHAWLGCGTTHAADAFEANGVVAVHGHEGARRSRRLRRDLTSVAHNLSHGGSRAGRPSTGTSRRSRKRCRRPALQRRSAQHRLVRPPEMAPTVITLIVTSTTRPATMTG